MDIITDKNEDISIFRIVGRLDSNTSPALEEKIADDIGAGSKFIIMDFEALEYISSAGLRVILKTTKELNRDQGKLVLCAMKDYVREVFEISGFDSFLPIVSTFDDALNSF